MKIKQVNVLNGGLAIDERGELAYVNEFPPIQIKRIYWACNHSVGTFRGWHGRTGGIKFAMAVSGAAIIGIVQLDNLKHPSKQLTVQKFLLSTKQPKILSIPGGYAEGWLSLTSDTKLIFLSTQSLNETKRNELRYPADYWNFDGSLS